MKTNLQGVVSGVACAILAVGMVTMIVGCSSTGTLAKEETAYPKEQVNAQGLFEENCARCHGKDGRARTFHGRMLGAQNFTDAKWHADTSTDEIINAIKTGPKSMPAFDKKLSEPEIEALAAYVQTFKPAE